MAGYQSIYGSGAGGGLLYPDSAARPFASNSARNTWANNNKEDLIKDTTVVNVGGSQWYLWTGESNPDTVSASLWMDAAEIVPGEKGDQGDVGPQGLTVTNAVIDGAGELIISLNDGSTINAGVAKGTDGTDGLTVANAEINQSGDLIITLSDGSTLNAGFVGGADPKDGFELNAGGNRLGLNNDGALTVRNSLGEEHNAVDNGADTIRIGSPNMELELRTNQERVTIQNGGSDNQLAYLTDIPSPTNPEAPERFAYWIREDEYVLSEEEIQKEVMLMIQPGAVVGADRVCTVTFPSQATFTNHYYIPGINDADAGSKPHIESFRFSIWLYYYSRADVPAKIIMNSTGNWLPFVSSESLSETNGVYLYKENVRDGKAELHTFAFMRPINFNPAVGVNGWSFQNVHPYDWIPLNDQPPQSPPVSLLANFMINDDESSHLRTGTGINSTFDPLTGEHTLTVDPTNIDLSGYAELDTDVSFSKVTVQNATDPLYNSVLNVTNGGNTEANLVGTSNIRKVDKATGDTTDVININGTSGAVDLRTDVTYQGAITNDKAPVTKEYLEAFGRGIGVPAYTTVEGGNNYLQTVAVASFQNSGTNINDVIIQIDDELLESETIITMPSDSYVTTKRFYVFQTNFGDATNKDIRAGDTWRVRHSGQDWFWEKVYAGGGNIVYGLGGRGDIITERSVKLFAYREGMPEHLLIETPSSSRLVHEFPRNKTFRFTPINSAREHDGNVTIAQANQGVSVNDLELGQYSDIPLYIIEPNVVVNRDQRAWINFPASITIDVTNGFYAFGTVSGWCGNNSTEGGVAVYVGTSENFRSYTQNIGFVLGNTGLFILDGQNVRTPDNNTNFGFNIEPGVTHMYRYAFYVDATGLMNYYVVDLNTGQVSQGTQQCNLASIGSDPKLYISYDRYANNTAAVAIAETHLVVNSVGSAEDRWNWRN